MSAETYLTVAVVVLLGTVSVALAVEAGRQRGGSVPTRDEVLAFVAHFEGATETFTTGCCFWFAHVLATRFGGEIFLDVVGNHFVTKIGERFYDVRGDVTDEMAGVPVLVPWDEMSRYDARQRERVLRDCVLKLPPETDNEDN